MLYFHCWALSRNLLEFNKHLIGYKLIAENLSLTKPKLSLVFVKEAERIVSKVGI